LKKAAKTFFEICAGGSATSRLAHAPGRYSNAPTVIAAKAAIFFLQNSQNAAQKNTGMTPWFFPQAGRPNFQIDPLSPAGPIQIYRGAKSMTPR
jgi:hypothetical protein